MHTRQDSNTRERTVRVHRVIPASAFRRLESGIARHKKSKKALRRMRKEHNDE